MVLFEPLHKVQDPFSLRLSSLSDEANRGSIIRERLQAAAEAELIMKSAETA